MYFLLYFSLYFSLYFPLYYLITIHGQSVRSTIAGTVFAYMDLVESFLGFEVMMA